MSVISKMSSSSSFDFLCLAAGCIVTVGLADLMRRYQRFRSNPLRHSYGPPPASYLWGYFWPVLRAPFMELHQDWWRTERTKHKSSIPFLAYSSLLGQYTCVILDTRLLQRILTASPHRPRRFLKNIRFLRKVAGDGMVVLEDGPVWSRHRRIAQPAFAHHASLRSNIETAVRTSLLQHVLPAWSKAANAATTQAGTSFISIDVHSHMSAITFDVVGKVAFGHDFEQSAAFDLWMSPEQMHKDDALSPPAPCLPCNAAIQSLQRAFRITPYGVFLSALGIGWLEKILNRSSSLAGDNLNQLVDTVIRNVRTSMNASGDTNTTCPRATLLEQLLRARDSDSERQSLSDVELRDEMKTFMVVRRKPIAIHPLVVLTHSLYLSLD